MVLSPQAELIEDIKRVHACSRSNSSNTRVTIICVGATGGAGTYSQAIGVQLTSRNTSAHHVRSVASTASASHVIASWRRVIGHLLSSTTAAAALAGGRRAQA